MTISFATTQTKTRNLTRGILQLRLQFDYPDEFGTPRSKSNALQLVFKNPTQGFLLTSLLSADQSRTLDFELEAPANASKFVEDPDCLVRKNTEESFRRNSPSRERATKLPERCHATCIQRLNTETINQSLQWDLSGALVFDSKLPTDFSGFQSFSRESNEVYRTMPRDLHLKTQH